MANNEIHWVCVGYDTRQQRHDALGYLRETAAQAEAICRQLHPHFEIYFTQTIDEFEKNR